MSRFRPDAALWPLLPPSARAEYGLPRHGWGECRCRDCAPEEWRGVDPFRFADELAKAAEAEGGRSGHF